MKFQIMLHYQFEFSLYFSQIFMYLQNQLSLMMHHHNLRQEKS